MSEADRFVQWVADCWLAGFSLIEILDSVLAEYGGLIPYSTTANIDNYKHCALETYDFLETQAEIRKCTTSY